MVDAKVVALASTQIQALQDKRTDDHENDERSDTLYQGYTSLCLVCSGSVHIRELGHNPEVAVVGMGNSH